jgi:hypothetical protein
LVPIKASTLLHRFPKAQQYCIFSHITSRLVKQGLKDFVKLPANLKEQATLIGYYPGDLRAGDILELDGDK